MLLFISSSLSLSVLRILFHRSLVLFSYVFTLIIASIPVFSLMISLFHKCACARVYSDLAFPTLLPIASQRRNRAAKPFVLLFQAEQQYGACPYCACAFGLEISLPWQFTTLLQCPLEKIFPFLCSRQTIFRTRHFIEHTLIETRL